MIKGWAGADNFWSADGVLFEWRVLHAHALGEPQLVDLSILDGHLTRSSTREVESAAEKGTCHDGMMNDSGNIKDSHSNRILSTC